MLKTGLLALTALVARAAVIDPTLARRYFEEAAAACGADGGKLWGVSLCGPIVFADRATRAIAASQADPQGLLAAAGPVYTGRLPERQNIANTAFDWAGLRWTMVAWPLPEEPRARVQLMMHELFHRVQDSLGLPQSSPANSHLDSAAGRLWLQLEWKALERALATSGGKRRAAIEDALVFRHYRRSLFPHATVEERALEMHEGLAEYTGVKLSGRAASELIEQIEAARRNDTFVRSFAYASGPAYGLLLDDAGVAWRCGLRPDNDFGVMLTAVMNLTIPADLKPAAQARMARYGGEALEAQEQAREARREQVLAGYRARLVHGPVLVVPLRKMNIQFDPNNLQPLGGHGTVYPTLRITDEWGALTVEKGALVSSDWTRVTVPAPATSGALVGDGWKLDLNPGWRVQPGQRKGDYTLRSEAQP